MRSDRYRAIACRKAPKSVRCYVCDGPATRRMEMGGTMFYGCEQHAIGRFIEWSRAFQMFPRSPNGSPTP